MDLEGFLDWFLHFYECLVVLGTLEHGNVLVAIFIHGNCWNWKEKQPRWQILELVAPQNLLYPVCEYFGAFLFEITNRSLLKRAKEINCLIPSPSIQESGHWNPIMWKTTLKHKKGSWIPQRPVFLLLTLHQFLSDVIVGFMYTHIRYHWLNAGPW